MQKTYGKIFSKRTRMSVAPCIRARALPHYRLFFLLHFYNNTAILKAMKRRATGLTMQLISPKSSFPLQDGKHSRQIEQMPQNNKIAASTNKLSVSLFQKVLDTPITGNTITRYSVLGTRYSVLGTRYSVLGTRYSVLD